MTVAYWFTGGGDLMRAAMRPCPVPGCPHLTDRAKGCPVHRAQPTAYRGDTEWRAFAAGYLSQHPLCERCRRTPAVHVHHIQSLRQAPHRRLDLTNVMALCATCHREVTPTAHPRRTRR